MVLTNLHIERLKPSSKTKKFTDSDGLYLLVTPNGAKYWRLKYRFIGKEKLLALGTYPEITLQEARDKRYEARKLLAKGIDPNSEKKEKGRIAKYNANNTFKAVAVEWYDLNKDNWSEKYSKKVWNRLNNYVFPVVGNRPINEVSGLEILNEIIRKMEKNGNTEASHKLLQNCSAIFRLAFITKRVPYNPLSDLRGILKPHRSKKYPTIKINELPEFHKKLERHKTYELHKLAIKMLILTFVRQGELRKSKWEYFDFEKKIWCIPAEIMKMRQEHIVPLSSQAIKVLTEIRQYSGGSEYLFPTINKIKYPYMNENVINNLIRDLGYEGRLVAHGFRALASTTLNELGFAPDVIEKQLAHSERNQVRAAYNRAQYLPQRNEMMQMWGDYLDNIIK